MHTRKFLSHDPNRHNPLRHNELRRDAARPLCTLCSFMHETKSGLHKAAQNRLAAFLARPESLCAHNLKKAPGSLFRRKSNFSSDLQQKKIQIDYAHYARGQSVRSNDNQIAKELQPPGLSPRTATLV